MLNFSQIFVVDQICLSSYICCLSHRYYVSQTVLNATTQLLGLQGQIH